MNEQAPPTDEEKAWQELMEVLVVGALRGMAEAHAVYNIQREGMLPPLNELDLNHAALVLLATIIEASPGCTNERDFGKRALEIKKMLLDHLRACRSMRGPEGRSTLDAILEQAGVSKTKAH